MPPRSAPKLPIKLVTDPSVGGALHAIALKLYDIRRTRGLKAIEWQNPGKRNEVSGASHIWQQALLSSFCQPGSCSRWSGPGQSRGWSLGCCGRDYTISQSGPVAVRLLCLQSLALVVELLGTGAMKCSWKPALLKSQAAVSVLCP